MQGRPVPREMFDADRVRGRPRRPLASGTASRSSRGSGIEDVEIGFPGMPTWGEGGAGPGRRGPGARRDVRRRAGVEPVRAQRPRRSADPHYSTSSTGSRPCGRRRRLAGRGPEAQVALVGDWNIAPENDDVWDMAVFAGTRRTSPRRSGPPSGPSSTPGTPTSSARTPPAPASTRTGTTSGCASRVARACGSTSCSGRPRSPAGSPAPSSTARSARARAPATTHRSSSSWPASSGQGSSRLFTNFSATCSPSASLGTMMTTPYDRVADSR